MSNRETATIRDIADELCRAIKKWPGWPTDPIHAAAIVSEESGELVRAANRFTYEGADLSEMKKEAVQVGAMAMRFLAGLEEYERQRSKGVLP